MPTRSWPPWATEPVELCEPNSDWPRRGVHECRRLEELLAQWLTRPVEHVGSTAVPGLAAKPILDLQAATADLGVVGAVAATLAPDGWHFVDPDLDQRPWRRFFVKVSGGRRCAHLHLMTGDCLRWHDQLAFRDELCASPSLRAAYAKLKRDLAVEHADDREAYTAAKSDFIHGVLARSRR